MIVVYRKGSSQNSWKPELSDIDSSVTVSSREAYTDIEFTLDVPGGRTDVCVRIPSEDALESFKLIKDACKEDIDKAYQEGMYHALETTMTKEDAIKALIAMQTTINKESK